MDVKSEYRRTIIALSYYTHAGKVPESDNHIPQKKSQITARTTYFTMSNLSPVVY
jgi:hypothetical protein